MRERILIGWGAIEAYAKESRPTLIRKGYPIQKDCAGSVWADAEEIDEHRVNISEQMRSNVDICEHGPEPPL